MHPRYKPPFIVVMGYGGFITEGQHAKKYVGVQGIEVKRIGTTVPVS